MSDYEFKTYKTGGAELEAGFYSTDELRDLVKGLDMMNAAAERSMGQKTGKPMTRKELVVELTRWNIQEAYKTGVEDERKRIVDLLQEQNKHKDRQNFYAYIIKIIEEST